MLHGRGRGGAALDPADAAAVVGLLADQDAAGTSMPYDRRAGRATEHDALYGAVLRVAARHGVPTPTTRTIAALLAAGEPTSRA
ncbi:ketopantoate reductase C-terminal domain-containing protein [Pseudonocardia kunmingensis]|uniref:ketopantoate reductase C-terminal domain-containing protein n=1 Tax=Pseudonocardia kunmingensis TaxID=630975 RepID=UPI00114DB515